MKVHPEYGQNWKGEKQPVIATDIGPLEQKGEQRNEEPCEQMRPRQPVDGRRRHDKAGRGEGYGRAGVQPRCPIYDHGDQAEENKMECDNRAKAVNAVGRA